MKYALAVLTAILMAAGVVTGTAGPFDNYVGGGTLVAKNEQEKAVVDDGAVVCVKSNPRPSLGGGCVLFGPWDSIEVNDTLAGSAVAFQVCIDNNGDQVCGGGDQGGEFCRDEIFFSHDDAGTFYNPLGPLPMWFAPGCPGGPWPGYVVFLCQGVHNAGFAHAHSATAGAITGTIGGTGFGDFCQPPQNGTAKQYFLQ